MIPIYGQVLFTCLMGFFVGLVLAAIADYTYSVWTNLLGWTVVVGSIFGAVATGLVWVWTL